MAKNAKEKSCKRPEKKLTLYFRLILKIGPNYHNQRQKQTNKQTNKQKIIKPANPGKWGESDYHIIRFKYPV